MVYYGDGYTLCLRKEDDELMVGLYDSDGHYDMDNYWNLVDRHFQVFGKAESIQLPDMVNGYPVTSIGYRAFYGCKSFTSITIPDSMTSIDDKAFYNCNLTSITIPDSVTSIGVDVFADCDGLTSATIGKGVTSINDRMFISCNKLNVVTIPISVTNIGSNAFQGCQALTNIIYEGTIQEWTTIKKGTYKNYFFDDRWDLDTGDYTVTCTDGVLNKR